MWFSLCSGAESRVPAVDDSRVFRRSEAAHLCFMSPLKVQSNETSEHLESTGKLAHQGLDFVIFFPPPPPPPARPRLEKVTHKSTGSGLCRVIKSSA
ncbi:hypothetical protein F2P81_019610 [Scophthalmus maximus]|uniref:Uncharacterized protein n=1 Tax=Scophthalmus maximus TaxID=52904 RepID=A0A6A4S2F1_SCOMX|nr:hypothetical protein F2P81_019609 [Scophthalmus maximus]KAF0028523.1 hypothetical protein F2P81_019610 [Scophthalmus maximus]